MRMKFVDTPRRERCLKISMSLDGFVAGPDQSVANESSRVVEESVATIGATIMGPARPRAGAHRRDAAGRAPQVRKMMRVGLPALAALWLAACSSQQLYNSAAGLRQQECNRMLNRDERERCLKSAERTYEDYEQRKKQ